MTIHVQVFPSYPNLVVDDWTRLCSIRSVFQELAWYQSIPAVYQPRFVVAFRDNSPIALLPFFIFHGPDLYYHTPYSLLTGFRERAIFEAIGISPHILEQADTVPWYPAAVAMTPYGYKGGIITNEYGEEFELVAHAILIVLDEICRHEGIQMLAHFYLNQRDDSAWIAALAHHGAHVTVVGADCNMDVRWNSIDAYFQSLTPSRARTLRAERRKSLSNPEVTWRVISNMTPLDPTLLEATAQLFAQTALKHLDPAPPLELYKNILFSWPGTWYLLIGETSMGTLRSAVLAFAKNATLYPKFTGSANVRNDYFFLVYSFLLELAISQGITRIEFGGGSHQAKLLRGASPRWLFMATQTYNPLLKAYLDDLLPLYEKAKTTYFSQLANRYQVVHPLEYRQPFSQV